MMPSEFEYLDSACEMTVLPQPNAPGMAHVPAMSAGCSHHETQGFAVRCPKYLRVSKRNALQGAPWEFILFQRMLLP